MRVRKAPSAKVPPAPPAVAEYVLGALRIPPGGAALPLPPASAYGVCVSSDALRPADLACATEAELAALAAHLAGPCAAIDALDGAGRARWPFPKSDMFHWLPLLDVFDDTMRALVERRWAPVPGSVSGMLQAGPLTASEKSAAVRMLQFVRLLLENCTSRNIYASYDRLKRLLTADDAEVVEAVLELLLIPARKLDAQTSLRATFDRTVGTDELGVLAQLPAAAAPRADDTEGVLHDPAQCAAFRLRHAERASAHRPYTKMLATALYLLAQPEGAVDAGFFAAAPTLIGDAARQLAALVASPGDGLAERTTVAVLSVLRSCLKAEDRWPETVHALALPSPHGPVATLFRGMVESALAGDAHGCSAALLFAHMDLVAHLAAHVDVPEDAFVHSGIVGDCARLVCATDALGRVLGPAHDPAAALRFHKTYDKALYVLDALVHQYATAADVFYARDCPGGFVRAVALLVDILLDSSAEAQRPVAAAVLQAALRFVDKLLTVGGADERLRNLFASPLTPALQRVFNHAPRFPDEVFGHAVAVVAAFVHNEPTALAPLQEAGLPRDMLHALRRRVPPVADLVVRLPHAYSALCLNAAGAADFASVDPVPALVALFLQPEAARMLRSRGSATTLGAAMDEFVRHHPRFRALVVGDILAGLERLGDALRGPGLPADALVGCVLPAPGDEPLILPEGPDARKRSEPVLSQLVESACLFVEAALATPATAGHFASLRGADALLGAVLRSGGITYDFTVYNESLSLSHLVRQLADADASSALGAVVDALHAAAASGFADDWASFASAVPPRDASAASGASGAFQSLCGMLMLTGLLRDLLAPGAFMPGSEPAAAALRLATDAAADGPTAVSLLVSMHCACACATAAVLSSVSPALVAAALLRAKADFKGAVYATFHGALHASGLSSVPAMDADLASIAAEASASHSGEEARSVLYALFALHRVTVNVPVVLCSLVRLSIPAEADVRARLLSAVASSAVAALGDILPTVSGHPSYAVASLALPAGLLHALLFDDSARPHSAAAGAHTDVLPAFVAAGGANALTAAVQAFMARALGAGALPRHAVAAVGGIVSLLARLALPSARDAGAAQYCREISALFCREFLKLPADFRRALGPEVLGRVAAAFAQLVAVRPDDAPAASAFAADAARDASGLALGLVRCAPDAVPDVAELLRALATHGAPLEWLLDVAPGDAVGLRLVAACVPMAHARLGVRLASFAHTVVSECTAETAAAALLIGATVVYLSTLCVEVPAEEAPVYDSLAETVHSAALSRIGAESADVRLSCLAALCATTRTRRVHDAVIANAGAARQVIEAAVGAAPLGALDSAHRGAAALSLLVVRHVAEGPAGRPEGLGRVVATLVGARAPATPVSAAGLAASKDVQPLLLRAPADACAAMAGVVVSVDAGESVVRRTPPEDAPHVTATLPGADAAVGALVAILLDDPGLPVFDSASDVAAHEGDPVLRAAHFRRVAALSSLYELTASFKSASAALAGDSRLRSLVDHLLASFVPCGELGSAAAAGRLLVHGAIWAASVVENVAHEATEASLSAVCDSLVCALRASGAPSSYASASRLWCLCMASLALLSSRGPSTGQRPFGPEYAAASRRASMIQGALAARLLDRGLASVLAEALRSADARVPSAPALTAKMVEVLELAARIAVRSVRVSAPPSSAPGGGAASSDEALSDASAGPLAVGSSESESLLSSSGDEMRDYSGDEAFSSDYSSGEDYSSGGEYSSSGESAESEDAPADEARPYRVVVRPPRRVPDAADATLEIVVDDAPDAPDDDAAGEPGVDDVSEEDGSDAESADTLEDEDEYDFDDDDDGGMMDVVPGHHHGHGAGAARWAAEARYDPFAYSSAVGRDPEAALHPLVSHVSSAAARTEAPDADAPGWAANADVFAALPPRRTDTLQRWAQETRLFLPDADAVAAATLVMDAIRPRLENLDYALPKLEGARSAAGPSGDSGGDSGGDNGEDGSENEQESDDDDLGSASEDEGERPVFVDDGPDADFLNSMPFDMRREVLAQYFAERRERVPQGARIEVSAEFLSRLDADVRETYVAMSAADAARMARRAALAAHVGRALADPASHLARDAGLFGGALSPAEVQRLAATVRAFAERTYSAAGGLAGAGALGRMLGERTLGRAAFSGPTMAELVGSASGSALRAFDARTLASVLRSFYDPAHGADQRVHMRLLAHVCALPGPRTELLDMLLYVLQESPEDMGALERALSVYCASRGQALPGSAPATPKKKASTPVGDPLGGAAYVVVQQRTLHVLRHLVQGQEAVRRVFLGAGASEWTIRVCPAGRGRVGGRAAFTTTYPLVLLLACLERSSFAATPLLVEGLFQLLAIVAAPRGLPSGTTVDVPSPFLGTLVRAAVQCEMGPRGTQYAADVLRALPGVLPPATGASLLAELGEYCVRLADATTRDLSSLVVMASSGDSEPSRVRDALHVAAQSASAQTRLSRALSLLASLVLAPRAAPDALSPLAASSTAALAGVLLRPAWRALYACASSALEALALHDAAPALVCAVDALFWVVRLLLVLPEGAQPEKTALGNAGVANGFYSHSQSQAALENALSDVKGQASASAILSQSDAADTNSGTGLPQVRSVDNVDSSTSLSASSGHVVPANGGELAPVDARPLDVRDAQAFAEKHRGALNRMVRENAALLASGSLAVLLRFPKVLDFDNKRVLFRTRLGADAEPRTTLPVRVRRDHVFEDSYAALAGRTAAEVRAARLQVRFEGEEGMDAGGVTREWFGVLSRAMFNPHYALFAPSAADKVTYHPNRTSWANPSHVLYFGFAGRVIGKALREGVLLDSYFTRAVYKHALGLPVDLADLEAADPEFYKSLRWVLDTAPIEDADVELSFAVDDNDFGTTRTVELVPGGADMLVTEANKREYVRLVVEHRLVGCVRAQLDAFVRGLHDVVPREALALFDERELELLISGLPEIDVDEWRAHTEYTGYTASSPQIQWFWRAVRAFDAEQRAKLFQFVTGSSKVPLEGMAALQGSNGALQRFQIHRDYGARDRLPSAHTCFNQLDLPEYDSYEALAAMLLKALSECATGFGLV